eukprot:SAG31_NODE_21050_length_559_cov_0.667391_1_plen_173_part_01
MVAQRAGNWHVYYDCSGSSSSVSDMLILPCFAKFSAAITLTSGAFVTRLPVRLFRFKRVMDRFEEDLYSVGPLQVLKLLLLIFVMAHWLSCGWFYFGDDDGSAKDSDGNIIQGWATKQFTGESDAGDYVKYVRHVRLFLAPCRQSESHDHNASGDFILLVNDDSDDGDWWPDK